MDKLNSYGLILSFVNRKKWNYCAVFWENYVNIRFKFYTCFKHIIFLGEGFYRNCIGSNTLILFGVKWVFFCNVFLYVKKFFELNASQLCSLIGIECNCSFISYYFT